MIFVMVSIPDWFEKLWLVIFEVKNLLARYKVTFLGKNLLKKLINFDK